MGEVNQRLIAGEAEQLRALLPEALEFLLRPYVGEEAAAREAGGAGAASAWAAAERWQRRKRSALFRQAVTASVASRSPTISASA